MKTKTLLLLALAGTSLATACEKTLEYAPKTESSPAREITFGLTGTTNTDVATKATTQVDLTNLGTLYVSAMSGSNYAFQNAEFTKGTDDKWRGGKYWPASNPYYKFSASNISLDLGSSHPSLSVQNTNTDVLAAYLDNPSFENENALTLRHVFAQLGTVTMKAPAGYTVTNLKLKFRPIQQGKYYIDTDTWSPGYAVNSDVYIFGEQSAGVDLDAGSAKTSQDHDLWLLPGDYTLTATYTISKGDYSRSKTARATVTLYRGFNNNIGLNGDEANIPEPTDIKEISFTVTVTPWSDKSVAATFTEKNN